MARMLPNALVGTTSPEVARVFRLLKQLPDERYTVWHSLLAAPEDAPDFLLVREDRAALLLKVSAATPQTVQEAQQPNLFQGLLGSKAPAAGFAAWEKSAVDRLLARLNEAGGDEAAVELPAVLLFPNVERRQLRAVARSLPPGLRWAAREDLAPAPFESWLEAQWGPALSEDMLGRLRRTFSPESVIPAEFTVRQAPARSPEARQPIARHTEAGLTDYLFDYDQEWALKIDLQPPEEAPEGDYRLRLVNGVAGSGKSLLIVYRAHLLRQLYPESKVLILTHNKPLALDLRHRYRRLSGETEGLPWIATFLGWCRHHWQGKPWVSPMGVPQRETLVERIWFEHGGRAPLSASQFRDEIDWFKDRPIRTRSEYVELVGKRRDHRLSPAHGERVFEAMLAYEAELRAEGLLDWGSVPRHIWRLLDEGHLAGGVYDAILIDEAQFFAPIWFDIVKRMLKPGSGQLFLAADPSQGFLKRGQSWLASGLEVRNRSLRLSRSYRTTREILDFATQFYRDRLPEDDEDAVAPDLLHMPAGLVPQVIMLSARQDEVSRVVNEIKALAHRGVPRGHILVIHAHWQGVESLLTRLNAALGPGAAVDAKQGPQPGCVRVCTLDASTGLESPIVFLAGISEMVEQEQSLRIADDERVDLMRDHTRKLYMAMTRAGQRLVITYTGSPPPELERRS